MIRRILVSLLSGLLIAGFISEISFIFLQKDNRAPQVVELVIPAGTAARVARGETPPNIPQDLSFVLGDTLLVRNFDESDHQLGPLWIPAGASATLNLDEANNYALSCSFQPGSYFGIEVQESVTIWTRIMGIVFVGVPLGALLALYSGLVVSSKKTSASS